LPRFGAGPLIACFTTMLMNYRTIYGQNNSAYSELKQELWTCPTEVTAGTLGIAAVSIAKHEAPDTAPSDGPNMIPLDKMGALVKSLMAFDALAKADPLRV
jgi:3-deoxy-D-manno-octulosonic acid (KDO) 8-phosphate synthase